MATEYDKAVTAYFVPNVNAAFVRQTFNQMSQIRVETIQQFATHLHKDVKDCNYGSDIDNEISDTVLSKCTSDYIKCKLLEEGKTSPLTEPYQWPPCVKQSTCKWPH